MKFAHSLQLNAKPEWSQEYINYSYLKRIISHIEKLKFEVMRTNFASGNDEELQLISSDAVDASQAALTEANESFVSTLEKELEKVCSFYSKTERRLLNELENITMAIREFEGVEHATKPSRQPSSWPKSPLSSPTLSFKNRFDHENLENAWENLKDEHVLKEKESMRMRLSELFIELNDLKEYIDTNYSGFKKILKKFDKCTEGTLKRTFMPVVDAHFSFKDGSVVQDAMDNLVKIYSRVICHENVGDAWTELKQQLKEHVAFERSTVWKDMIELERKAKPAVVLPAFETLPANVSFWQRYKSLILLCIAIILLLILLRVEIFKDRAQRNCFALFIFVSFLWSAEVIPLFITSFFVPFLAIILNVLKNDKGETLSPLDASPIVFQSMFSQVIVLLLGGFSIAAALSKFNIAKSLAVSVLSKSGNKPSNVLLANMFVATFLSMWISNVAAPVLCFSIIQPILRTLPNNHPFSKCLIIGIAMASNVGGMASPISSPQNVFALERMSLAGSAPSWLEWFFVSIPICLICDLLIWSFLVFIFNPSKGLPEVTPIRKTDDPISKQQILITLSTILTILLWCLNPILKQYTGEMGTIAILPIIIFFGTGILHKDDFNSFPWTVVMLASGGLVLGKAVKSSGLLSTIAAAIQSQMEGLGLWMILLIFCTLILIVTSFVSHTVGAMVILPIVQEVGQSLPNPHPKLLVLGGAFMCSGAMGLPVSGFPNITAMALEDQTGKPFLNAKDFLKVGIPCSLIAFACIISLGYGLMLLIGF